jgi:hypothetical protein
MSWKNKIIATLGAGGVATGLMVGVPAATGVESADAAGSVYNSCQAGLRNSVKGVTYPSGNVVWIGCGSTRTVAYIDADAPTRIQRSGSTGSVCYQNGAWYTVNSTVRAWTVPSC